MEKGRGGRIMLTKEEGNALKEEIEVLETKDDNGLVKTDSPEPVHDPVNHPSHYKQGAKETIDVIFDLLTPDQQAGYLTGNIIKYISRYKAKNGIEDLKKAQWYLNRLIKNVMEKDE